MQKDSKEEIRAQCSCETSRKMGTKKENTEAARLVEGPFQVSLVTLLQKIQQEYGYLPEDKLKKLSEEEKVPVIELYRLATFYHAFKLTPTGKHRITVCTGTACHVRGSHKVWEEITSLLGLGDLGGTTNDLNYTVEKVNCLGACALAPLLTMDGDYCGQVSSKKARELLTSTETNGEDNEEIAVKSPAMK